MSNSSSPANTPSRGSAVTAGADDDGLSLGMQQIQPSGERVIVWKLLRNCALEPRQLAVAYGLLCLLSLLVGLGFAVVGAALILVFAGLEVVAVGVAMLLWARHAGDGEVITLCNNVVRVQRNVGPKVDVTELSAPWIRVDANARNVTLRAGDQRITVGGHARYACRAAFAEELRQALRAPMLQSI